VRVFERSLRCSCERGDFRVVHYSLQSNHVHLLVEAVSPAALSCGMKSVGARLARAVNRVFHRAGPVLADRYHLRVLKTPREVRSALRYVLLNARHHASRLVGKAVLDPASSARWFDGWTGGEERRGAECPVAPARTWLLAVGWRRHGPIDPADVPGTGSRSARPTSDGRRGPGSDRSRFFVKTVTSHTGASMPRPTNQRSSRLYSSGSTNGRSLRTE